MTTPRLSLPWLDKYPLRVPNPRWVGLILLGAVLGAIGGTSLLEMLALMIARMLFIVFTTAFLIIFFVVGIAMARKATPFSGSSPRDARVGPASPTRWR